MVGNHKENTCILVQNESVIWCRGYTAGAKEQREKDREHVILLLAKLETVPGIGVKTAEKVRSLFLDGFQE